jgi:hypothetical protein
MNADEALRRFAENDDLPREGMAWALEHWDTAAPRFVARLRAFAAGATGAESAEDQVFYILHLCGQMRETRAYEPLCRLIAGDPDIEVWLGGAIDETLPGILINVFDGDVGPLLAAIEQPAGDEFARGSALAALGYLVRSKRALADEAMRELLRRLRREALPRDVPGFWSCWAETAAALGYEDLKMEAALLAKEGVLDAADFGLVDFDRSSLSRGAIPRASKGFTIKKCFRWTTRSERSKPGLSATTMRTGSARRPPSPETVRSISPTSTHSVTSAAMIRVPAEAARNTRSAAWPREPGPRVRARVGVSFRHKARRVAADELPSRQRHFAPSNS